MTHPSSPPAPMTARLRELMTEATPGPFVITTNLDFWIEQADHPDDNGFYGVAHCGDISWPKSEERQQEWEANARLIALLLNNAPTILRLLEAVEGVEKAIEPFRGAYDVKPPTADKWPDDKPLHECLPGIWPTWGDLKRLRESLATLRAAREGAR